jgi:hypothetical protein
MIMFLAGNLVEKDLEWKRGYFSQYLKLLYFQNFLLNTKDEMYTRSNLPDLISLR